MLKRGNTGFAEVDGERNSLSIHTAVHGCNEILRINVGVIPELVKLVDNLFNGGKQ
jgi:hypothetical protein